MLMYTCVACIIFLYLLIGSIIYFGFFVYAVPFFVVYLSSASLELSFLLVLVLFSFSSFF